MEKNMTLYAGIIGGGNISDTHCRAVVETAGVEISAIFGQNHEKASRLASLYGGTAYRDLEAFLAHRPLHLVLIGSPSGLHASQGIRAAQCGLHVLVEKPIDITIERAGSVIRACDAAGVKLGVFFQDRAKPHLQRVKELIVANRLGKPILGSATVRWYRPPEYYGGSRWRGTWELDGGGALMNQGIHTVDLLLWLLGDVARVSARAMTAWHKIEAEDTAVAILEFKSGAVGTLEVSTAAYPGYHRRVELTGTEGSIIIEQDRVVAAGLRTSGEDFAASKRDQNQSASSAVVSDVRGHQMILEDFLRAINEDRAPFCDGREARRSVALVQGIYESSRTGQSVTIGL
jgi:UDP-N-acetyl-2-amino-2-deoxyglucuronate dehydrogenase